LVECFNRDREKTDFSVSIHLTLQDKYGCLARMISFETQRNHILKRIIIIIMTEPHAAQASALRERHP